MNGTEAARPLRVVSCALEEPNGYRWHCSGEMLVDACQPGRDALVCLSIKVSTKFGICDGTTGLCTRGAGDEHSETARGSE